MKNTILCSILFISLPSWSQIRGGGVTTPRENFSLKEFQSWTQIKGEGDTILESDDFSFKRDWRSNLLDFQDDDKQRQDLLFDFASVIDNNQEFNINSILYEDDSFFNLVKEYHGFVEQNRYLDDNIYKAFLKQKNEAIDKDDLNNLYHYWLTDMYSPSILNRYQNSGNHIEWQKIQKDMVSAMDMIGEISKKEDFEFNHWGHTFENNVYIHPYKKEITQILMENNSLINMEEVRQYMDRNLKEPSMIDFSLENIQRIILESGNEIPVDDFKELVIIPLSYKWDTGDVIKK